MQRVDPPHHRQIGRRSPAGQVVDAAPAELQGGGLLGDRECVGPVDHRFALSIPALLSAPSKKSFSSVISPIFACSVFKSTAGVGSAAAARPNTPAAAFQKLRPPLGDLVRVDIEALREFRQRLLALDGRERHLRLEGR